MFVFIDTTTFPPQRSVKLFFWIWTEMRLKTGGWKTHLLLSPSQSSASSIQQFELKSSVFAAETLQKSAERKRNGCVWKREPDGEVWEAIIFSPLSSQGNQPKMSSFEVTGHGWRTGNGCWRTEKLMERDLTSPFKLKWYNRVWRRQRGVPGWS